MRISDWSSDVCSSDLDRRPDRARAKLCGLQPGQIPLKPTYRSPGIAGDDDGIFCHGNPCFSRSEEHTSELQSLMRISYAVFCLKKKKNHNHTTSSRILISSTTTTVIMMFTIYHSCSST